MADIAGLSDQITRMTGGSSGTPEALSFYKDARVGAAAAVATIAGFETSLWEYNGNPSHGSAPGSILVPVNTTPGGQFQTNPGGGRQKWLIGGWATASVAGTLFLYDRLRQIGGLSGVNTSAQTTNGTPITRNTGGLGNEIWVEINTQIGTTATTATCAYTNQAGAGATTPAFAIGATNRREAQRILRVPLALGDYGVRDVSNIGLLATTGTAGAFSVVLARPLGSFGIPGAGLMARLQPILFPSGPLLIDTDACLSLSWLANGTGAPEVRGGLFFVEA